MKTDKKYFYIPCNQSFSIVGQCIPDLWNTKPRFVIHLNTWDTSFEIDFASKNEVKMFKDALSQLLNEKTKETEKVHTCVVKNESLD
jgi:hypothetical protein